VAQARLTLQEAQQRVQQWEIAQRQRLPATATDWLASMAWRVSAHWWLPLEGRRIRLRRLQPTDAAWLKLTFEQPSFANAVNRDYGKRLQSTTVQQLAHQLAVQWQQPPPDQGAVMWLIEQTTGQAQAPCSIGLATFTNMDAVNRRAEFIIGFAGDQPAGVTVLEAGMLLTEFAFLRVCLNKVSVSIYADNPRLHDLQDTLQKLGFQPEGVLRAHVKVQDRYLDLHLLGAIGQEVLSQARVHRLAARFLGRPLAAPVL
jgi:RimJ/RimL family protein N-acetyltransferase